MASQEESIGHAKDPRRRFGDNGEDVAEVFFFAHGFRVVERNWSCRMGEIDLIVERAGTTHFIEVKTRRTSTYGYPEEAITKAKLTHLARAIETYLRTHPTIQNYQVDALAIMVTDGKPPEFHYIEAIL